MLYWILAASAVVAAVTILCNGLGDHLCNRRSKVYRRWSGTEGIRLCGKQLQSSLNSGESGITQGRHLMIGPGRAGRFFARRRMIYPMKILTATGYVSSLLAREWCGSSSPSGLVEADKSVLSRALCTLSDVLNPA